MKTEPKVKRYLNFKPEHWRIYLELTINVTLLLIVELFHCIKSLFVPKTPENVKGQLCLVTGGAGGLGRCLALEFASRGCNIALADIVSTEATVKEIRQKFDVKCEGFNCDITDVKSIVKLKSDIEVSMGQPVNILVNNAAIILFERILETSMDEVSRCVDVNLTSHIKMIKTFLPDMISRQNGRIVTIASIGSKITVPILSVYCATKYGIDGFMEALFDELCCDGHENAIKLTTVFPYYIYTNPNVEDVINRLRDPFPRFLPEEVAKVTVDGVLIDKRKIYITPTSLMLLMQKLPDRLIKYLKSVMVPPREFRSVRKGQTTAATSELSTSHSALSE